MRRRQPPPLPVPLPRGERVLAAATTSDGAHAFATTGRFLLSGEPGFERRWIGIESATWDADTEELAVRAVDGTDVALSLPARADRSFLQVVRERLQATLVTWQMVEVPGGQVRIALRKDGDELVLQERAVGRADLADPRVRAAADAAARDLAAAAGAELPDDR